MGRPDIVADPQSPNAVSEYQSLPPPTVTEGTCVLGPTMCGIACPTHRLEGTATSTIEAAEAKVVGDSRVVLKEKLVKNFSVCIHPPPGVLTTRSLPARRVGPPNLLETWADDTSGIRRRKTRTPPREANCPSISQNSQSSTASSPVSERTLLSAKNTDSETPHQP